MHCSGLRQPNERHVVSWTAPRSDYPKHHELAGDLPSYRVLVLQMPAAAELALES
eukprot:CAMPEP_0177394796 /NCGR_PEP_ID=MMETSP0368-20130122/55755_1 /TAXON_ID=447022 ORGANISM="Scrippsiella hangoei-like, Strain SHHI-4" /NCGR_SAMPLE_ID=MMETSP0368 /ASSEMBLY_ACC=CAM_ASM_000363 /LENGTH=54 /DNA_ID=CAMNT_0018861229 /DNA_START=32 /DNA_END=192 /DNA_ORIENTATION=-